MSRGENSRARRTYIYVYAREIGCRLHEMDMFFSLRTRDELLFFLCIFDKSSVFLFFFLKNDILATWSFKDCIIRMKGSIPIVLTLRQFSRMPSSENRRKERYHRRVIWGMKRRIIPDSATTYFANYDWRIRAISIESLARLLHFSNDSRAWWQIVLGKLACRKLENGKEFSGCFVYVYSKDEDDLWIDRCI